MVKPNLEVNIAEKTLVIDKNKLSLDDKLVGAESSKISNSPEETALELSYSKKDFSSEDEANKIYSFLENYNLHKKIDVNFYSKEDFDTDTYPAVALTGKFNAKIYE